MTLPSKTRLAKQKLEIREVRKEKQTTTSKKHDKKCFKNVDDTDENKIIIGPAPKTSPKTKIELLEEMHLLKELNEALLEEVKSNEETIANLENKERKFVEAIKALEDKIKKEKPLELVDKGNQADDNAVPLFCEECDYPSETLYDLGEHMGEAHTDRNVCEICDESFDTQGSLVKHIIKKHSSESGTQSGNSEIMYCNFCDESFQDKNDLMRHKKIEHSEKVSDKF